MEGVAQRVGPCPEDRDDLFVAYGDAEPVPKGVSLNLAEGELIALLGASGCGKTTLLRAISGFVPVQSGLVRVGAHSGTGFRPLVFKAEATKTVWLCGCKATKSKPICDGSHNRL